MKILALPLLIVAAVSSAASGQYFSPPDPSSRYTVSRTTEKSTPVQVQVGARLALPFNSTAETPDWKVVRLMAELSFLAYEDSIPSVKNRLRLHDLALGEFVTVDNHHFITAWDQQNDVMVIAFRGTDIAQLADYWTDLDYETIVTELGEVHKGFYDATQSLMRSVVAAIEHRGNPRHVWLTGHSLGGAIATLSLRQLEMQGRPVKGLVTFGQPRVGAHAFTTEMNRRLGTRMLRFINEDDVVTSLPPRIPLVLPAYYSGGSVIRFLNGTIVRSPGPVVQGIQPTREVDDLFGSPPDDAVAVDPFEDSPSAPSYNFDITAPDTPEGLNPPDPEPLTAEQFAELKEVLNERDPIADEEPIYGGPLGAPFDRLDLKRRAGNHLMYRYIQQIERFATEGK